MQTILASELNAYDVLCCDWIVFTRANLPGQPSEAETPTRRRARSRRASGDRLRAAPPRPIPSCRASAEPPLTADDFERVVSDDDA